MFSGCSHTADLRNCVSAGGKCREFPAVLGSRLLANDPRAALIAAALTSFSQAPHPDPPSPSPPSHSCFQHWCVFLNLSFIQWQSLIKERGAECRELGEHPWLWKSSREYQPLPSGTVSLWAAAARDLLFHPSPFVSITELFHTSAFLATGEFPLELSRRFPASPHLLREVSASPPTLSPPGRDTAVAPSLCILPVLQEQFLSHCSTPSSRKK